MTARFSPPVPDYRHRSAHRRLQRVVAVLTLILVCGTAAAARRAKQTEAAETPDPVALAALMIRDDHWDRAAAVLAGLEGTEEGVDRPRFFTLRGLVRLHGGLFSPAAGDFRAAIDAGPVEPAVHLYLAQALVNADAPARALEALDRAGTVVDGLAGAWLLRARANWLLQRWPEAWTAFEAGRARFPEEPELLRQSVLLLIELGLYQEASARARTFLQSTEASPDAWLALAEALRRGRQFDAALELLEEARLRFPDALPVVVMAAHIYLEAGRPATCGALLATATERDERYAAESAECFRRAGRIDRALYMNGRVLDPVEQTRQRLGLLLEAERYERAVALRDRLARHGLLEDDRIAYALAYAHFKTGDLKAADARLKGISDPELFRDATQLRQAMEACAQQAGGCG